MTLSSILRPQKLEDFLGQKHLVGENGPLRKIIESGNIPSMIFWGPPSSGKTTLAEIISNQVDANFIKLSAISGGKKDLFEIIKNSKNEKKTILFIDEIHRWNKAQQDALLPYVESGEIILIGATTENPSFSIISPLNSRSRTFILNSHNKNDVFKALEKGLKYLIERNLYSKKFEESENTIETLHTLAHEANGDIRFALNTLEILANLVKNQEITKESLQTILQKTLRYDKDGEEHYNLISAVHKSLRSSNASAAVYWIMRMLNSGEDPLYVVRRMIRFASEDIGNANPNALLLANVVYETCQRIGMPECSNSIVQLAQYLANCKKDNSAYLAQKRAEEDIKKFGNLEVPLHFRNAPTKFMKNIGYGKGYEYDHDLKNKKSDQECFPKELSGRNYFK